MAINRLKKAAVFGWETPNLAPPVFPQALNGVNGLIERPLLDSDGGLLVDCPIWKFPDEGDEMQVEYSLVGQAFWIPLDTIIFSAQPSGPFERVTIKVDLLGHGEFDLRFKVKPGSGGDYADFSEQQRVQIDLYGPYKSPGKSEAPARIIFPASLPLGVDITQDTLNLNPGGFDFEIPGYADFADGDMVVEFWFTADQPPDDAPSLGSVPMASGGVEINLPISAFDDFDDGNYFAYYRLIDAARNRSEISRITTGRRLKRSADLDLAALEFVAPQEGELVDIDAWRAGVEVAIPSYAWIAGDLYRLHWGSQTTPLSPLTGVFPFQFTVPSQLIFDEYADQTGPVTTSVLYEIVRTGSSNRPLEDTPTDVDLSVEGPPVVTPGDPSSDLDLPTIMGPASAPTPNYLNAADIDHVDPITATFNLWTVPPVPVLDMVITLFWGNKLNPAGSYTVQAGDGPGSAIVIEVDKAAIANAGNGDAIPVFYGVSGPSTTNINYSERTDVEVDGAITHKLEAAEFLNWVSWSRPPGRRLICASLRLDDEGMQHIEVKIPPSAEFFKDGTEVHFEFVGSNGINGDDPIESTRGTASVTLDAEMAQNGFIFELKPFDPHLKVVGAFDPFASIWLQYSVDVAGTPAKSVAAVIPARMVTAENYCDGSPATP